MDANALESSSELQSPALVKASVENSCNSSNNTSKNNYENIDILCLEISDDASHLNLKDVNVEFSEDKQLIFESPGSYCTTDNINIDIDSENASKNLTSNDSFPTMDSRSTVPDDATAEDGDINLSDQLNQPSDCLSIEGLNLSKDPNSSSSPKGKDLTHSSLGGQSTSELSSVESPPQERLFFCREWAWSKLWACMEQRPSSKTCGVLILGGPGTGKTALCSQLINPTCVNGKYASLLQNRILAHHFCIANDAASLSVASFIQSLVVQLVESPHISGYSIKAAVKEVVQSLDPLALQNDPDDAFRKAVLFPLLEIENPDKTLIVLVDSVDEESLQTFARVSNAQTNFNKDNGCSKTILELLSNHHHLLPQWLLLVITARRGTHTKLLARTFSGFRKIALDDLRRSHVVRDVQQYILCRLDTEPALRYHLSRETAEMLNQLHIKSNGCFLYLEKVLDGVVEGWVTLREIRDIPGTLNGLYLWLCQRLYPRKNFQRVLPLLSVILASRASLTQTEIQTAAATHFPMLSDGEWSKRWTLLRRVLCPYTKNDVVLFHHSFAEWLLDIKHCTQKYLVDISLGHAMLAMKMSLVATHLMPLEIQTFAFHLVRMPIKPPLKTFHLPLWLLVTGTPVKSSFDKIGLQDFASFKIIQEAGAHLPSAENNLETQDENESEDFNNDACIEGSDLPHAEDSEKRSECSSQADTHKSVTEDLSVRNRGYASSERLSQGSKGSCHEDENSSPIITTKSQVKERRRSREEESRSWRSKERRRQKNIEDPLFPYLRGGPIDGVDAAGRTLLHTASYQGDASLVGVLLQRGANYNMRDRTGQTPLNLAARHGHADVVLILLSRGADFDHADDDGWTSLRSAAWGGHVKVVECLLKGGAQADLADMDGRTALRAAAWGGHEDVVATLLENGANVNKADSEGRTPLIAAAYMGHYEIVNLLIVGGADINHADKDGRSALSVAALCVSSFVGDLCLPAGGGRLQVVTALLEGGADVNHQDKDGLTPLLVAAFEGHVDVCEILLEYDADVDHVDGSSRTPLLAAASMGHATVVEKLLFWGCYVDHIDVEGRTVLSVAAAQGSEDTVRLLLDRGLDETHRDNAGWTPLHYAAFEGHRNVCQALIDGGARINEVDNDGKHGLVLAAQEGHTDVVSFLLDFGASLHHTSHDGRSALRVAALEGHKDVVHLLLCREADIHYKDADGRSTLYLLALENHLEMAAFLLESGSDVESKDLEGRTPLHVTAWQGHAQMVELLLSHGAQVDAEDNERRTPLQSAAWQGNATIVGLLLQHGSQASHTCSQGATALSIAAQEGHENCVVLLLRFGANPSHSDKCGRTAIKVALKGGHLQIARVLEEHLEKQKALIAIKSQHHHNVGDSKTPCSSLLCPGLSSSPAGSPESTFEKRRSFLSLGRSSSKSSCNLSSSTRSSVGGGGLATSTNSRGASDTSQVIAYSQHSTSQPFSQYHPHSIMGKPPPVTSAPPIPTSHPPALSFTQQLQQCGRPRGRKHTQLPQIPLTPLDDAASPIYVSPPISPVNDEPPPLPQRINPLAAMLEEEYALPYPRSKKSIQQQPRTGSSTANMMNCLPERPRKAVLTSSGVRPMFNQPYNPHSSMSGLGPSRSTPQQSVQNPSGTDSAASGFTFTQDSHMRIILGTASPEARPKRNGVVTNPSLKAAQAKAAHIFNGLTGKQRQSSVRPSLLSIKKETPL